MLRIAAAALVPVLAPAADAHTGRGISIGPQAAVTSVDPHNYNFSLNRCLPPNVLEPPVKRDQNLVPAWRRRGAPPGGFSARHLDD